MDTEQWMEKAEHYLRDKVKVGEVFELRDLFNGIECTELSKGDRIRFGKDFSNAVKENRFPSIKHIKKGENNHTRYTKVVDEVSNE